MMWKEFEELAGYEVDFETYNKVIEPMYMALPDSVTKAQFVKMLDKKAFALKTKKQIVNEMKKLANELMDTCEHYTDWDKERKVEELAKELNKRFYNGNAFVGRKNTMEGYRGCSFPAEVVVYDSKYTMVLERIELATPWYEK